MLHHRRTCNRRSCCIAEMLTQYRNISEKELLFQIPTTFTTNFTWGVSPGHRIHRIHSLQQPGGVPDRWQLLGQQNGNCLRTEVLTAPTVPYWPPGCTVPYWPPDAWMGPNTFLVGGRPKKGLRWPCMVWGRQLSSFEAPFPTDGLGRSL